MGVAGAPVTDWHYYDTIWTERYLDRPEDNPEGYAASSPITYAGDLADHLLIIHGTADDNVHPQNTLAMADALIEADKPFDMALYPRQKHGFRGAAERHVYERITAFFDLWSNWVTKHLSEPRPRAGASLSPRRAGKGPRDWGEIQPIVKVDRSGEAGGPGESGSTVARWVLGWFYRGPSGA